ncbi:hypothetical protein ACN2C7_12845 [Caulobacter sp. ErkDOM-E]|uniref:hypothetical protein n=1 Tax=Caulobacter sp. ErkDOM-E TaxID=3402778 RepID=UPI003AF71808
MSDILNDTPESDTIRGGAGADKFYFLSDAGLDKVADFSSAEGDKVLLDRGQVFTLSDTGEGAMIDLGKGSQLLLADVSVASIGEWLTFN